MEIESNLLVSDAKMISLIYQLTELQMIPQVGRRITGVVQQTVMLQRSYTMVL